MTRGSASPAGTQRYARRFADLPPSHFRASGGLSLSSIGIGTYLGDMDEATDLRYVAAVEAAVRTGLNVIDTASNYRAQRSERNIGTALAGLRAAGFERDEVVVATKAGFLPFDGSYPQDPGAYFRRTFLESGILRREEVVAACHCLAPGYLEHQLERSRANLGLGTIDIFYLHNPEMQLEELERPVFLARLAAAFAMLEGRVAAGAIGGYGCATWNGFRVPPDEPTHLSLEEVVAVARDVGGAGHHFRFVQLPYNLGMAEAWLLPTQRLGTEMVPFLSAARALDITVMTSASILQGQLAQDLPAAVRDALVGCATDAQRALQFVRSTPGVTTALVGMKDPDHVRENAEVARLAPADAYVLSALVDENSGA